MEGKAPEDAVSVFEDRGSKRTADQRLIDEQKRENQKLKETTAEIITENLEVKKDWKLREEDMKSLFPEIKLTAEKTVTRSGFTIFAI